MKKAIKTVSIIFVVMILIFGIALIIIANYFDNHGVKVEGDGYKYCVVEITVKDKYKDGCLNKNLLTEEFKADMKQMGVKLGLMFHRYDYNEDKPSKVTLIINMDDVVKEEVLDYLRNVDFCESMTVSIDDIF